MKVMVEEEERREGRGLKGGLVGIVRHRVRKKRVAPRQSEGRAPVCKLG